MPLHYRRDALLVFGLLAFAFAYFYQVGGWNESSRFDTIFAIVQEGRFTIDSYQDSPGTATGDTAYFDGHYYSDKAIGPAAIGAILYKPLYLIKLVFHHGSLNPLKKLLTYAIIGIPSAFAGALLYLLCLYMSGSRFRSYVVAFSITLGTLYFPFSLVFFSHQFTSALLFCASILIFFLKERKDKWKMGYAFLLGWLLGWALISEYQAGIIVVILISYYIYVLSRNHNYRQIHLFVLPILGGLFPVLLQMAYNRVCFGNYWGLSYAHLNNQHFGTAMSQGLMGIHWPDLRVLFYMTFHPIAGIFWESPVLLLCIPGLVCMFVKRRFRVEAILAMGIIGSLLIIMSGYFAWWGNWSVGPRFIIPMLPYFCIPLVHIPKRLTWPLVVLGLVSFCQMLIVAASTAETPDGWAAKIGSLGFFEYSNIYSYCLKELEAGRFTLNLGTYLGINSWNSLIPFLVVICVVTYFFLLLGKHENWPRKIFYPPANSKG
jgi:hypothetical protein